MSNRSNRTTAPALLRLSVTALVLVLAATALCSPAVRAQSTPPVVTIPTDLNPGDQYRLAFVTDGKRNATSKNIADYNAFVTAQAGLSPDLVALGTTWTAIGSTFTVTARDNTGTNPTTNGTGVPIYLLSGDRIANNNHDLWNGSIATEFKIDQYGASATSDRIVATGTKYNGDAKWKHGSPYTLGERYISTGDTVILSGGWVAMYGNWQSSSNYRMYAISDVLTVPSPPCADNWSVATEAELNDAIACYNAKTNPGNYTITLTQGIDLTASTTTNATPLAAWRWSSKAAASPWMARARPACGLFSSQRIPRRR